MHVDVSTICKTDYSSMGLPASFTNDGRFNWPSQVFSQICQCKGNYGGYDCSECKFGYKGQNCTTKTMRVRKSITAADFNWTEYHSQLNRAKRQNQTRYKVYTGGNITDESSYKEVTMYHLFVWLHHHATRTALMNLSNSYNASQSGNPSSNHNSKLKKYSDQTKCSCVFSNRIVFRHRLQYYDTQLYCVNKGISIV